jgi:hypothetical protein
MAREEGTGLTSRQLPGVSRLPRSGPADENRFGTDAYEAKLSDGLWGIYHMIGKLNPAHLSAVPLNEPGKHTRRETQERGRPGGVG